MYKRQARKGDDSAETLEVLLRLRRPCDQQRLLHYDVVNNGRKTPLDVAIACTEIFSTGKGRTIYDKVIRLFLDAVEEDARDFEKREAAAALATPASSSPMVAARETSNEDKNQGEIGTAATVAAVAAAEKETPSKREEEEEEDENVFSSLTFRNNF